MILRRTSGGAWAMAKMNMVLHGITDSELVHGDTLAAPGHEHDGELRRFDRILTNPPFAQNYRRMIAVYTGVE